MKKKNIRKKFKEIKLPVEFNPGTQKYEPILPLRKGHNQKVNFDWWGLIIFTIILATLVSILLIALKNST